MKRFLIHYLVIILLALVFVLFLSYSSKNTPSDAIVNSSLYYYELDNFSTSENLHWMHLPITFSFSGNCTNLVLNRNRRAFTEITNQTDGIILFQEIENSSSDISIFCYKEIPQQSIYLTSGEAQFWSASNIITRAVINFYNVVEGRSVLGCTNFPDVEIHEILHTFGFQHRPGLNSIMREIEGNCIYKIDRDIIQKLEETYSRPQ